MRSEHQTATPSPHTSGGEGDRWPARSPQALLISADELAVLLAISTRSLWRLRSAGRLPQPLQLGGSVRWRLDEVQRWIASGCPALNDWHTNKGGK